MGLFRRRDKQPQTGSPSGSLAGGPGVSIDLGALMAQAQQMQQQGGGIGAMSGDARDAVEQRLHQAGRVPELRWLQAAAVALRLRLLRRLRGAGRLRLPPRLRRRRVGATRPHVSNDVSTATDRTDAAVGAYGRREHGIALPQRCAVVGHRA